MDDDRDLCDLLIFVLERAGLKGLIARDRQAAFQQFAAEPIDLVVLDVNLGADNGFDLLEELRQKTDIPIVMLTANDKEDDIIRGLGLGADDYVTKPFNHRELVARIEAHLRRSAGQRAQPVLAVGSLTLSVEQHQAAGDGKPLQLTATEFRLLRALMSNARRAVTTTALLQEVWGYKDPSAGAVVRVAIHRLRKKLATVGLAGDLIVTVPGIGFRLVDPTA